MNTPTPPPPPQLDRASRAALGIAPTKDDVKAAKAEAKNAAAVAKAEAKAAKVDADNIRSGKVRRCAVCDATAPVRIRTTKLYGTPRRPTFGLGGVVATVLTCGLWLIVYFLLPRQKAVVGKTETAYCTNCGAASQG